MPAPIIDGSDRLASICTRPTSVPIIPKAGAIEPIWSSIFLPAAWRWCCQSSSRSMMSRTVSDENPSITSWMPLAKKRSSTSCSLASSASSPSLRARLA